MPAGEQRGVGRSAPGEAIAGPSDRVCAMQTGSTSSTARLGPRPAPLGAAAGRVPPRADRPGPLLLRPGRGLGRAAVDLPRPRRAAPCSTSAAGPATSAPRSAPPVRTYWALDADVGELSGTGEIAARHRRRGRHEPAVRATAAWTSATPPTCSSTCPTRGGWPTRCCGSPGPAGIAFISYTVWYGPWGGHETAPWHYLGGRRARRRYAAPARPRAEEQVRRVAVPGDRPGRPGLGARQTAGEVLDVLPRYNPRWATGVLRVPGAARGR